MVDIFNPFRLVALSCTNLDYYSSWHLLFLRVLLFLNFKHQNFFQKAKIFNPFRLVALSSKLDYYSSCHLLFLRVLLLPDFKLLNFVVMADIFNPFRFVTLSCTKLNYYSSWHFLFQRFLLLPDFKLPNFVQIYPLILKVLFSFRVFASLANVPFRVQLLVFSLLTN